MEYAYKFRIYPNKEQEKLIQKTFGCCRFVYNYYLNMRKTVYEEKGESMGFFACGKDLTLLKKEKEWLREVNNSALQCSLRDLDRAYDNFFRGLKENKSIGFPNFKTKKSNNKSYRTNCMNGNIRVQGNAVKIPSVGLVKCRVSRPVQGRILSATVSQEPSGKYFVSLCCTEVELEAFDKTGKSVGLDVGIKSFAVSSDGEMFDNPKYLRKSEKKLAKLQRELSRKTKGSNNREKARLKVARLHEHISNQRNDMLHKLSTHIVKNYDVICLESLAASNMVRNRKLSKSIVDASWGEFDRQIHYKSEWYGKTDIKISRFYASTQTCSECGNVWAELKNLKVRKWVCPVCGTEHDRDTNAAVNILNEGLRLLA